jgi:Trypsin-like peptidase domain
MAVHNLPDTPAFIDARPDDPISEFALRVVIERPNWNLVVVGTATMVTGHLAVTARHVLEYAMQTFGFKAHSPTEATVDGFEIKLYQILPRGPIYRIWSVVTAWPTSTDIVFLHLGLDRSTAPDEQINWRSLQLRVMPPPVGQKVVAFGYHSGKIEVTESPDGTHHIELNDRPTTSIGTVRQIYPTGRDRVMLSFPCYEIEARFDPGMSGGMVIDEEGALCGLICASLQQNDPNAPPISYVASLWPMLKTSISVNRGDKYPRDVSYPVVDLALDGLISVKDLSALDPLEFPLKNLPGS